MPLSVWDAVSTGKCQWPIEMWEWCRTVNTIQHPYTKVYIITDRRVKEKDWPSDNMCMTDWMINDLPADNKYAKQRNGRVTPFIHHSGTSQHVKKHLFVPAYTHIHWFNTDTVTDNCWAVTCIHDRTYVCTSGRQLSRCYWDYQCAIDVWNHATSVTVSTSAASSLTNRAPYHCFWLNHAMT